MIRHASFKRFFVCLFVFLVCFCFFVFLNDYGTITATIERNIIQKSKKKKCDVEFEDITLFICEGSKNDFNVVKNHHQIKGIKV